MKARCLLGSLGSGGHRLHARDHITATTAGVEADTRDRVCVHGDRGRVATMTRAPSCSTTSSRAPRVYDNRDQLARSRLKPVQELAKTLRCHLDGIVRLHRRGPPATARPRASTARSEPSPDALRGFRSPRSLIGLILLCRTGLAPSAHLQVAVIATHSNVKSPFQTGRSEKPKIVAARPSLRKSRSGDELW